MGGHRIVLSGGGTGGHIYPALSVAEQLVDDDSVEAILYIGASGHLEERIARERGLEFVGLSVTGMPRKFSPAIISWTIQTMQASFAAKKVLTDFKPTAVLGTGGYASAPPLVAAIMMGVPFAVHEPDAHPGLVNRLFASRAQLVSCGMEGGKTRLGADSDKVVVNGNPIRKGFVSAMQRDAACAVLGLNPSMTTLVVTGGSQGARAINESLTSALSRLLELDPAIAVVHQAGERNITEVKESLPPDILNHPRYHLRPYFDDLSVAYAACDLVVSRAGAMTIAELAATGTPAVFIPFPFAAADHQMHNARALEAKGACVVIPQDELTPEHLGDVIVDLLGNREKLATMKRSMADLGKPQAAHDLAQQLKELSRGYMGAATR